MPSNCSSSAAVPHRRVLPVRPRGAGNGQPACEVLREFRLEPTLAPIEREKQATDWIAPVMLNRPLALPERDRLDLSSLRWQIGGKERTPEERVREFRSPFPNGHCDDGYGLTDSCQGDTLIEADREIEKVRSTDRVLPHVELRVCDDCGRASPAAGAGETCLRGLKFTAGAAGAMRTRPQRALTPAAGSASATPAMSMPRDSCLSPTASR